MNKLVNEYALVMQLSNREARASVIMLAKKIKDANKLLNELGLSDEYLNEAQELIVKHGN